MHEAHPATSIFLDLCGIRPERPDLHLLHTVAREFSRLPWENLTKFLKKHTGQPADPRAGDVDTVPRRTPFRLSEEVLRDHALLGTGGTCFSLTHALRRVLTSLGYAAYPAMADMHHGPNVHCGLVVLVAGRRYLLDPGYLVPSPVPLDEGPIAGIERPGHHLEYRRDGGGGIELRTVNARGERRLRYRLRPEPVGEAAFRRHWAASFEASGMRGLQVNRFAGDRRLSAHDYNLRIDSGTEKINLKLRGDYAQGLATHFGIDAGLATRALEEWRRVRWPSDTSRRRS